MTCGVVHKMQIDLQHISDKREIINSRYKTGTICAIKHKNNYLECLDKTIENINAFWSNDQKAKEREIKIFLTMCGLHEVAMYENEKNNYCEWIASDLSIAFWNCINNV